MEKIEGTYVVDKETPGTIRYRVEEIEGEPNPVTTIYIRKWGLGSPPPERIRVTVEEA